jgi:hypothetical protein
MAELGDLVTVAGRAHHCEVEAFGISVGGVEFECEVGEGKEVRVWTEPRELRGGEGFVVNGEVRDGWGNVLGGVEMTFEVRVRGAEAVQAGEGGVFVVDRSCVLDVFGRGRGVEGRGEARVRGGLKVAGWELEDFLAHAEGLGEEALKGLKEAAAGDEALRQLLRGRVQATREGRGELRGFVLAKGYMERGMLQTFLATLPPTED